MRKIVNRRLKSLKVKMRRRTSLLLRKPKKVRGKGKGRRKLLSSLKRCRVQTRVKRLRGVIRKERRFPD